MPPYVMWIASSTEKGCRGPHSCSSGTVFYPGGDSTYCGASFFCTTGIVGETFDPLAVTHATPSISVIWCETAGDDWTAWRTILNAVNVATDATPLLVAQKTPNSFTPTGMASSLSEHSPMIVTTNPPATSSTTTSSSLSTPPPSGATGSSSGLSQGSLIAAIIAPIISLLSLSLTLYAYYKKCRPRNITAGSVVPDTVSLRSIPNTHANRVNGHTRGMVSTWI